METLLIILKAEDFALLSQYLEWVGLVTNQSQFALDCIAISEGGGGDIEDHSAIQY